MKVLQGNLIESRYDWPHATSPMSASSPTSEHSADSGKDLCCHEMNATTSTVLELNQVAYIHDKIGLHRISSGCQPAVSLHLVK